MAGGVELSSASLVGRRDRRGPPGAPKCCLGGLAGVTEGHGPWVGSAPHACPPAAALGSLTLGVGRHLGYPVFFS